MAIREGRWRCPRCRSENLGRFKECSGCGDTRDDEVEFYLPEGEPEVSDEALLARAQTGPEKLCEFCDASNPAEAETCENCSAPLTARSRDVKIVPEDPDTPKPEAPPHVEAVHSRPKRTPKKSSKWFAIGCLGVIAALIAIFIAGRFIKKDETLTVIGATWERSFEAEKLVTVTKRAWKNELPAGARQLSSARAVRDHKKVQTGTETVLKTEEYREQVGTEKVKVGTKDLGNGFFEDVFEERPVFETKTRQKEVVQPVYREDPIYDTQVTYEIDEWQVVRRAEARGDDLEPQWPVLRAGEREKQGTRGEKYTVKLRNADGKVYTREVPEVMFGLYRLGSQHVASVDSFGNIKSIKPK